MFVASTQSIRRLQCALCLCAVGSVGATYASAQGYYQLQNLVSDNYYEAPHDDANLINPWGLAAAPTGKWWVANEDSGKSTLYDGAGVPDPLVVSVPTVGSNTGGPATGIVFNPTSSFVITDGTSSAPAFFLFAGLDGLITGWNPNLPPPPLSTQAHIAVNNSAQASIYIGLALASTASGDRLYAADFHNKRIDVFDGLFQPVNIAGAFTDPQVPSNFSPFNVMNLNGQIYVAYAWLDKDGMEEVTGPGQGFVSVYSTDGTLVKSLIHRTKLNAPWGMAIAPSNFGEFSNMLLVGNLGNGRINAFDPVTGKLRGTLRKANGFPVHIDGLWGIAFGNGGPAGPTNALYFCAGVGDEEHGVFGRIDAF
jgi:uncharacterized protein (TIGR03118 family)